MISRIEGELLSAADGAVELRCGAITYTLLVPAADEPQLAPLVGHRVEFHTLHYLESQGQGSSFVPRLIGFGSTQERAFFELLTTVKGLGMRKALRALRLPYRIVARAIAAEDLEVLKSLPEIGQRTAQTIVAELHGKLDRFLELKPDEAPAADVSGQPAIVRDAMAALVQLGESKPQARLLIEQALAAEPTAATADDLVAAAYRVKETG
ncbi:MAG: Holliday junction branch migration protein RuvA [Planctomycetota bacterium]